MSESKYQAQLERQDRQEYEAGLLANAKAFVIEALGGDDIPYDVGLTEHAYTIHYAKGADGQSKYMSGAYLLLPNADPMRLAKLAKNHPDFFIAEGTKLHLTQDLLAAQELKGGRNADVLIEAKQVLAAALNPRNPVAEFGELDDRLNALHAALASHAMKSAMIEGKKPQDALAAGKNFADETLAPLNDSRDGAYQAYKIDPKDMKALDSWESLLDKAEQEHQGSYVKRQESRFKSHGADFLIG